MSVHPTGLQRKNKPIEIWELQTGMAFDMFMNHGWRDATVLIRRVNGDLLIEYSMPNGTTALQMRAHGHDHSISYKSVPLDWLEDMVQEGIEWECSPQRRNGIFNEITVAKLYAQKAISRFRLRPGSTVMATHTKTFKRDLVTITQDMISEQNIPLISIQTLD